MPANARPWNDADKGTGWWTSRGPDGVRGAQYYLVDTADEGEALYATGLPLPGSPWGASGALASLTARTYQARYLGGKAGPQAGLCVVEVGFGQDNAFSGPEPVPLKKWLAVKTGKAQVLLYQDVRWRPGNPAFEEKLLNGDGFARNVGVTEYIVHRFVPLALLTAGYLAQLRRLNDLQAVNTDQVTFPPVLGGNVTYTLQPGECQFLDYEIPDQPARDDLYHVTIQIATAEDHLFRWTKTDEYGKPYQSFESEVYEKLAFGALW